MPKGGLVASAVGGHVGARIEEAHRCGARVEDLGFDGRRRKMDAIIGALAMEKWALIPNPKTGEIDLTALKKREFTNISGMSLAPCAPALKIV
jgi:hypothetical protein